MIQAPSRIETEQPQQAKAKASILSSYVLLALLLLVAVDLAARLSYPYWSYDRYNSPNRSWVWWASNDFRKLDRAPDIVLLGSSLMMAAVHGGDATYTNVAQNTTAHHHSQYFEDLLGRKEGKQLSTFSFAIGGQMASDAYVIIRALCQGERKPQEIVFGIAPRDFMDNCLANPASTETFRYLSRISDLSDIAVGARTSLWDLIDYGMGKISFIYGHRLDLLYLEQKLAKQAVQTLTGYKDLENVHTTFHIRQLALIDYPEDTGPNEVFTEPFNGKNDPYKDNLAEYASRYRQFNRKLFNQQVDYLDKLLAVCKDRQIKVTLVNMPITQDNVNLMPAGLYKNYLDTVAQTSTKYGARLLDLNDPRLFTKQCFADSVHLNGYGGMRFFEVLSNRF
ncbi:MAG TPA: D-alanyl-lipoteichoic acid biosynthesis protein DltD [Chroococcales cyanobacterium]